MIEIYSDIEINASAEKVWEILTNFQAYSEWNPMIKTINGELAVGAQLEVVLKSTERETQGEFTLNTTIIKLIPNQELRLTRSIVWKILFHAEHIIIIESLGPNRVMFRQATIFRGVFARWLENKINKTSLSGFDEMNAVLKERAEGI